LDWLVDTKFTLARTVDTRCPRSGCGLTLHLRVCCQCCRQSPAVAASAMTEPTRIRVASVSRMGSRLSPFRGSTASVSSLERGARFLPDQWGRGHGRLHHCDASRGRSWFPVSTDVFCHPEHGSRPGGWA